MRVGVDPIKSRKGAFDYKAYEREIKDAAQGVADTVVRMLDRVVSNWDHAPEFRTRMTVVMGGIAFDVFPVGPNKQIFIWVDKGTRDHWVAPRRARALAFQQYYAPHTQAGGGYGGPGKAFGPMCFSRGHNVSGIRAREITRAVAEEAKPLLVQAIRDAIREAAQ